MRIAYLSTDPGIPVGGVKGAAIHVRSMAAALAEQGHAVRLLAARVGPEPLELGGAELERWPVAEMGVGANRSGGSGSRLDPDRRERRQLAYNRWLARRATGSLRAFGAEAIYERYALFGTAGGRLARRLGLPHILEVNAPLCDEQEGHRQLHHRQLARRIEGRVLRRADRVYVVSEPLAEWARRQGVAAGRLRILPNGVDAQRFAPDRRAAWTLRRRLGIAPDCCVVGFCGSLKPWHDLDTLLAGYAEARRRLPSRPMALLVVGAGPRAEFLFDEARRLGIQDEIHLSGGLPHAEVPAWLAAMDLAVAPYPAGGSGYFSPLKLFEYMAAERAVLASVPGQAEQVLVDGFSGRLYPAGDARALGRELAHLAQRPALRARYGRAARAAVLREHTWSAKARLVAEDAARLAGRREEMRPCPAR